MPVITRCEAGIDTLQQFNGWLIIRVLWNKTALDGKVENFALGLLDCVL